MKQDEIAYQAKEIITGQLRAVVAQMDIDEINSDRKKFNEMIEESVAGEVSTVNCNATSVWLCAGAAHRALHPFCPNTQLAKLGLELVNVNITDVNDASGKIEAQVRAVLWCA